MLLSSLSCSTKKTDEKLIGHWHSVSQNNWAQTIDIEDTVTITDKYQLLGGRYFEYPRLDKNGLQMLPADIYKHSATFSIINDTLSIQDSIKVYQYVRSNLSNCLITDRYINCQINILLEPSEKVQTFEVSHKQFCSDDLFIGKLKSGSDFTDSLTRVFPDSIFIQASDVLILLSDIPDLCKQITRICGDDKNPININLHADINVPNKFMKHIEQMIPGAFSLHRIVKIDNKDIGLNKIR